jgi:hypothetical protein
VISGLKMQKKNKGKNKDFRIMRLTLDSLWSAGMTTKKGKDRSRSSACGEG